MKFAIIMAGILFVAQGALADPVVTKVALFPNGTVLTALVDLPFVSNELNDHYGLTVYTYKNGQPLPPYVAPDASGIYCSITVEKGHPVTKGQSLAYESGSAWATSADLMTYSGDGVTVNQSSVIFSAGGIDFNCISNAQGNAIPTTIGANEVATVLNGVFSVRNQN